MADNYTHFPYPDDFNENNQTLLNIRDILKEGSYLFYELEDCTIEVPLTAEINDSSYEESIKNYWIEKSVSVAVKDGDLVTPSTITLSAKKRESDTDYDFTDGIIKVWKGDSLIDDNLVLNELIINNEEDESSEESEEDTGISGKFEFTPDPSVEFYTIRLYLQSEELDTELLYVIDKDSDEIVPILTRNSIHLAATPSGKVSYYGTAKSTIELYRNGEKILDGITYGPHSASLGCSLDTDTIRTEEVQVDRLSADSASVTLRATFEGRTYSQIFSIVRKKQSSHNSSKFYTKNISPFFYDRVMDNEENWDFLDIITEEIPFYHKEPNRIYDTERIILSATRDIGVTNVPSPLQDNDFYSSWFRDSLGYVKNSMILDIYNKMRYPYILENQYLNARILNNLADVLVKGITDSEARLALKSTDEENAEVYDEDYRFYGHEVGCLDYMEDVVERKVNSIYSLIDFNPEYLGFLSDWVESSYMSGKMTYEESKEESLVYKLQDIRGELLRRKFAGTYSLYMLLLSSIGKTGSYLGVISAGDSNTEAKPYYDEYGNILGFVRSFNDTRPLRVPNLPGLFTQFTEVKDYMNPISIYYDKPEDLYKIPLGTLIPLFYTSADIDVINGEVLGESIKYNNELFYKTLEDDFSYYGSEDTSVSQDLGYVDPQSVLDYKLLGIDINKLTYRSNFYRDSANIILWDNMPGIMSQESILDVPYTLDTIIEDTENPGTYRYRTLDEIVLENGKEKYIELDTSENRFDLSSVYGSVLDVTADDVLYHRNTLQKEGNYEFVTYPIADGNGLCLMDTAWLNYVEYYSKQKSKVNEDITFGVQISTYMQVDDLLSVPYEFFTYEIVESSDNPKKVRLYHNLLNYLAKDKDEYSSDDYRVISIKQTLMSVVSLKHEGNKQFYDSSSNLKSEFKEFEKFTKYNVGILPITYKNMADKIEGFQMGYDGGASWNDDLSLQGLAEAYFVFSNYDIPNPSLNGKDPADMSDEPDFNEVKSVYFIIKRIEEGEVKFSWSSPMRLFNNDIVSEFLPSSDDTESPEVVTFGPDWKGLVYYLNPYLNFVEESASPIRHKKVLRSYFLNDTTYNYVDGPSNNTGLCNLTRMRHKDYLCNDTGKNDLEWINPDYKGLFLNRIQSSSSLENNILILGDNRNSDLNEVYYESIAEYPSLDSIPVPYNNTVLYKIVKSTGGTIEYYKYNTERGELEKLAGFDPSNRFSDIYTDEFEVPSLLFKKGTGKSSLLQLEHQSTLNGKPFIFCLDLVFSQIPSGKAILLRQGSNEILYYENGKIKFNGLSLDCNINTDNNCNYRITVCSGDDSNGSYLLVNNEVSEEASSNLTLTDDPIEVCPVNFLGEILDFRVYNETKSLPNLEILNAGTFYEVYSYAPSNYKLAHTIYVDNSLIRMVDNTSDNRTTYGIKDVSSIRVFNRSVWDSIMLDMYPVSLEEADPESPQYYEYYKNPKDDSDIYDLSSDSKYLSNCIEQTLIEGLEVFNGRQVVTNTTLIHNNERHSINQASYVTAVLALIQPVDCKDEALTSMGALKLNNAGNLITLISGSDEYSDIVIPMKADSSDDYFRYSADLNVNFKISPETNFSWFMARGTNIGLTYYNNIEDVLTTLTDDGIKGSEKNYVLMPLCVPNQSSSDFYLDRLYVRNFSLARTLTNFLRATTYYTEIKIPVPCEIPHPGYVRIDLTSGGIVGYNIHEWATLNNKGDIWMGVYSQGEYTYQKVKSSSAVFIETSEYYYWDDNLTAPYYYNKWDAIRYFKEGEYTFTCKYPVKILPFSDDEYSSSSDYNTVYGTMRFKVVVSGTPKEMTDKEHLDNLTNLGNIPDKIIKGDIESTLKSSSNRVEPEDNKTFPHRLINIELYVYDIKSVYGKSNIAGKMTTDGKEDYEYEWVMIASNDRDKAFIRNFESAAGTTFDDSKTYYRKITEPTVHYDEVPESELSEDDVDDYFLLKEETPTDITYLDSDTLDHNTVITKRCPMFLSNNYTEAFYIHNYDRSKASSITSGSNDDDLIDPIVVKSDIFSTEENLLSKVSSSNESSVDDEEGVNKIVLLAGKSYKILFDMTSKVTEFGTKIKSNAGGYHCSDLITSLVAPTPSDYLYTESGEINSSKYNTTFSTSSFGTLVVNGSLGYCWDDENHKWLSSGGNLGDPYSYDTSKNLLAVFDESNKHIAEAYQIRYLDKIMVRSLGNDGETILTDFTGSNIKRYYRFGDEISYKAYNKNDSIENISLKESDIIKYHYESLDTSNIISEVESLDSIISGFSYIEPHFIGNGGQPVNTDISIAVDSDTLPNESSINNDNGKYRLCSRQSYPWYIPFKNNAYILRTGSISNNLIQESITNIVNNNSSWNYNHLNLKYKKIVVPEGQDYIGIFVRKQVTDGHIYLEYTKDECKINSIYTMEIWVKAPDNIQVGKNDSSDAITAKLYHSNEEATSCELNVVTADTTSDGWKHYVGTTTEPVLADSIKYDICVSRGVQGIDELMGGSDDNYINFKDAKVTRCDANKYQLGLSEIYGTGNSFDSSMIISSHTVPMFRRVYQNDTDTVVTFIPIQFKPEIVLANKNYRPIPGIYRAAAFISSCAVDTVSESSRIRYLKAPWIRRLNLYYRGNEAEVDFHKYGLKKDSMGTLNYKEVYSAINDIYSIKDASSIASVRLNDDRDQYLIRFTGGIKMNLADDGTIAIFNNNLKVNPNYTISLVNERTSFTYNCFNLNKYRQGLDSYVGITNIQLLNKNLINPEGLFDDREVIYEIEYLPIIYNELKNHISFNIMFNHNPTREDYQDVPDENTSGNTDSTDSNNP